MAKKNKEKRNVVFRRIGGRIVPISIGMASVAKAADLARTKTVYKTKNVRIDKKAGVFLPIASASEKAPVFGTGLNAYNSKGKFTGRVLFDVNKEGKKKVGSIDWLSVKKRARGQGVSKKLVKQAAIEMKGQGAKTVFSHVVHKRSAELFEGSKVKSKYFKSYYTSPKTGESFLRSVGKKEALGGVGKWKKPEPILDTIKYNFKFKNLKNAFRGKQKESIAAVFREVSIPKNIRKLHKPFRSVGNKLGLVGFSILGAASLAYGLGQKKGK